MSEQNAPQPRELSESTALVLGGSSGVGLATALRLAKAGSPAVAINGRNAERGAEAVKQIEAAGGTGYFIAGDAGDPAEMKRIVAEANEKLGRIDIAVSAVAPAGQVGMVERADTTEAVRLLNALTLPPMLLTFEVVPLMKESGGGAIISVASDAAKVATPGESLVGAGMSAITMFARTAAMEVKRHGIRVNALTPSLITGTGTTDKLFAHEMGAKIFGKVAEKAQLGVPNADEVAGVIEFLASPAASKVTAQVISINGGISAG